MANKAVINYESTPVGSLISRSETEDSRYLEIVKQLPAPLEEMARADRTGSFIRGLAKNIKLPSEKVPLIAFIVLQIITGEKPFAQLAAALSSDLKIPNDKAQKIAAEIEKDLLAPISGELNKYLKEKKIESSTKTKEVLGKTTQQNVLDLKDQKRRPSPPPLPR